MKLLTLLIGLLGLGVAVWLVIHEGPELIFATFAAAGLGILIVPLAHIPHYVVAGRGWQVLWPPHRRPPLKLFIWVLWVREAVNALLPVARIGGEVACLSLLRRAGLPLSSSVASLVVETTLSVITTFLFVLVGLALLAWRVPGYGAYLQWLLGLVVSAVLLGALVFLQRAGGFRLFAALINRVAGNTLKHLVTSGRKLDRAVMAFYGRPWRVFSCGFWSFLGWGVGAFEIWVALIFLQHSASFIDAFILEAMILAMGSAAFFVPASLGVQEGTFLFFGNLLGLPSEVCLALALLRRCRDLIVMVPGLIAWQAVEFRRFGGAKVRS
jgi:putative membrane protein